MEATQFLRVMQQGLDQQAAPQPQQRRQQMMEAILAASAAADSTATWCTSDRWDRETVTTTAVELEDAITS